MTYDILLQQLKQTKKKRIGDMFDLASNQCDAN